MLRKTLPMSCGTISISPIDRRSGSAGMPRPISYAAFCLKKDVCEELARVTPGDHEKRSALSTHAERALAPARETGPRPPRGPGNAFGVFNTGFFFNDTATTEIYTLSLHDALPIFSMSALARSDEESICRAVSRAAAKF